MTRKSSPPSIKETAFDCPHCGAFTTQYWHVLYADRITSATRLPFLPDADRKAWLLTEKEMHEEDKQRHLTWINKMESGLPFLGEYDHRQYASNEVGNLFLSQCFNCEKIAVWVNQSLIFPEQKMGFGPNHDLPEDIFRDFEEAREILNLSPRGSAALLRLCVQKLCAFLGEKGENINDDIASLVTKGLNPLVQQSLDIVRVIGNDAVHPGSIDLKDDRDTALRLLQIINGIADQMITHPKMTKQMYDQLPEEKRKAIESRNEKALKNGK